MYPQRSVMTCGLATALEPPHFNHAPVWGATACATRSTSCPASFNPRTRVGCDSMQRWPGIWRAFVSIHAPAWGATFNSDVVYKAEVVSIHAPAWGATLFAEIKNSPKISFNPRTRVGCDPPQIGHLPAHKRVSIHAPAWGATGQCLARYHEGMSFNPRTRVGCDALKFSELHPHPVVSIHAPAWGATG